MFELQLLKSDVTKMRPELAHLVTKIRDKKIRQEEEEIESIKKLVSNLS